MRQSWTDARLDDGFDRVDAHLRAVRAEVSALRVEANERFDRVEQQSAERFHAVDERFDRFEDRFDHQQRMFFQLGIGVLVALLGVIATQL